MLILVSILFRGNFLK